MIDAIRSGAIPLRAAPRELGTVTLLITAAVLEACTPRPFIEAAAELLVPFDHGATPDTEQVG